MSDILSEIVSNMESSRDVNNVMSIMWEQDYDVLRILQELRPKDRKRLCAVNKKIKSVCEKFKNQLPSLESILKKYGRRPLFGYSSSIEDRILDTLEQGVVIQLDLVDWRTDEREKVEVASVKEFYKIIDEFYSRHPEYKGQPSVFHDNDEYYLFDQEMLIDGNNVEFPDDDDSDDED